MGGSDDAARAAYEAAASGEPAPGCGADHSAAEPTDDPSGSSADSGGAPESADALVAEVQRERDEYLDALRRERAEFENFRKRTTKERMDALDRGAEMVVANLLRVLDSFGLALAAAESADEALAKGVGMVHTELLGALTSAGLEEVPGVGTTFDPNVHEAVAQVDAAETLGEEVDEPVVVEVLRPGYRFKGRVLRPASVKVAR